eukprot:TRINITY_DN23522_c0_g1_i1.p1 TRINITY_DN23522_c0_g1~~TRINITY_DN23522_c0_g1_i1.p1  ORF type:complete len:540 (-),score=69.79 TRINITY_DN23522_c0_g1_i1:179-1798(-)
MIDYNTGTWGISFIFTLRGSVFPKAFCIALPNAAIAALLSILVFGDEAGKIDSFNGIDEVWSGYTFVLGFLIVFRNNQAYSRFWEGVTLTNQIKGEWFNSISSLFAFCSAAEEKSQGVVHFQHRLVRLASMLHCTALQQICALDDDTLDVINLDGFDVGHLDALKAAPDPCEIVVNWLQRLIVQAHRDGVLHIEAPILSRAFQELSRGAVNLSNVRKIRETPFPFPYSQMIVSMLLVHWIITPLLAAGRMVQWQWASVMCFLVSMSFWSLYYIALEIDQPFGEDANDLPVKGLQQSFNGKLLSLMSPVAKVVPAFTLTDEAESILPASGEDPPLAIAKLANAYSSYSSKLSEANSFERDVSGASGASDGSLSPISPPGRADSHNSSGYRRSPSLWNVPESELERQTSLDEGQTRNPRGGFVKDDNDSDAASGTEESEGDGRDTAEGHASTSAAFDTCKHEATSAARVRTAYTARQLSMLQRQSCEMQPVVSVGVPADPEPPFMPLARKSVFPARDAMGNEVSHGSLESPQPRIAPCVRT